MFLIYLTGMGSDEDEIIEMELLALGRRNRAIYSKNRKVVREKTVKCTDSELCQLQHNIISFLGQLDSTTCLALLKDPQQEEIIPWAKCLEEPLEFSLPFKDTKIDIKLGLYVFLSHS
jgi:hypothetical protein